MYGGIYGTKTMSTQIKKAHDAVTLHWRTGLS